MPDRKDACIDADMKLRISGISSHIPRLSFSGEMFGASTNGKSGDFGSPMWRFESSRPSQHLTTELISVKERGY